MTTTTANSTASPAAARSASRASRADTWARWALGASGVMQACDLGLTSWSMMVTGFCEQNPLALWIVRTTDSVAALALFKLLTAGAALLMLHRLCGTRAGRMGAWAAAAISVWLMGVWAMYLAEVGGVDLTGAMQAAGSDSTLVLIRN